MLGSDEGCCCGVVEAGVDDCVDADAPCRGEGCCAGSFADEDGEGEGFGCEGGEGGGQEVVQDCAADVACGAGEEDAEGGFSGVESHVVFWLSVGL